MDNICEECAMDFTLWLHNKYLKKKLKKKFIEKQYEIFKHLSYEERK